MWSLTMPPLNAGSRFETSSKRSPVGLGARSEWSQIMLCLPRARIFGREPATISTKNALAADERHKLEKPDFRGRRDDNRLIELQHLLMIHDDDNTVALECL